MKKMVFFLAPFVFLVFSSSVLAACPCQQSAQNGGIFSDPGFSQSTHNFSPGQIVYIRVETPGGGENKNELRILDAGKKTIRTLSMVKAGTGPYVYTASFSAPEVGGIYYLDIKIEGEGSSFASQENINVGGGSASVSSKAESVVVTGKGEEPPLALKATSTPWPLTPTQSLSFGVEPDFSKRADSFASQLLEFFRRLFSFFKNHL